MPERLFLTAVISLLLLSACSEKPGTGPGDVKWDRQVCERCRMVLSDRYYAAQVRVFAQGKRSKVFYFDDIGCATLWLENKPWKADTRTEIWTADHRNGDWIDGRKAHYVRNKITPMAYGLGAQRQRAPDSIDFKAAKQHVVSVEQRLDARGGQLQDWVEEQAAKHNGLQQGKP